MDKRLSTICLILLITISLCTFATFVVWAISEEFNRIDYENIHHYNSGTITYFDEDNTMYFVSDDNVEFKFKRRK